MFQFNQNYPQRCEKILRDIKNPKTRSKNVSLYSVVSDDKFTLPKYEWRKNPWWLHVTWTKLFLVNALARCTILYIRIPYWPGKEGFFVRRATKLKYPHAEK